MNSSQIDQNKYTNLASDISIQKTAQNLEGNNFHPIIVNTKEEALELIKKMIPESVSVMNGTSKTLKQIGYTDLLKDGNHKWDNIHEAILKEQDVEKQAYLRKTSVISDFYLGSAHAITENGEIFVASNSGSQLPHLVFTSPNIILVVSTQKIVKNLDEAFERLNEVVIPLEDDRMKEVYGFGTTHAKTLILHKENPNMGRKITVILVKEKLGF